MSTDETRTEPSMRDRLVSVGADAVRSAYEDDPEVLAASLLRVANVLSRIVGDHATHDAAVKAEERERIAAEIEAVGADANWNATFLNGLNHAAAIARGASEATE